MIGENEISSCIRLSLEAYFRDLEGQPPHAIYDLVLHCVEKPLLEFVLQQAGGNQSKAADILGMNRNTLRKKLKQHGIQ